MTLKFVCILLIISISCNKHQQFLDNHCRVCGKLFGKKKYSCMKYPTIVEVLGVDHCSNKEEVHPAWFCNNCYLATKRVLRSSSASTPSQTSQTPALEWLPHNNTYCFTCDGQHRGRPNRLKHAGGCPSLLTKHIRSVSSHLPSFTLPQVVDKSYINTV